MIFSLCSALACFAQGNGMAGISEATNMVTSYFDPLTKLIFAVAAILGLVGGVRVYSKFSSGDPDASKAMAEYQVNKGVGRQVEFQGAHVMVLWQMRR